MQSTYNANTDTYYGNPASSELAAQTNASMQSVISAGHLDIAWFDDTMMLEDEYANQWNCSAAQTVGYSPQSYRSTMQSFQDAMARPVLMEGVCNGDGSTSSLGSGNASDPAAITTIAQSSNTIGAMCESFAEGWQSTTGGKAIPPGWQSRENTALQVQSYGKTFVAWPYYGEFPGDAIDQRGFYYASFMLIYDPKLSMMKFNGWGVGPQSGVDVEPEGLIVPLDPIKSATFGAGNIDALKVGGVYVREFKSCFVAGSLVGPCATVVNPDPSAAYPLPTLSQTYKHALTLSGYGSFSGAFGTPNLGDNGQMAWTAAVPTQLAPQGWTILFGV